MSLLAPLYFLGALAVGLPILFHLIRRQPKGQVEFSSLMFLRPTPPRLTRRSRLDNWLLLLLRGLALILLAAAFARPFLRSVAISDIELPGRRIVLLVDTSASMQRNGLWQQALDRADDVLADLQPADALALVTFDSEPRLAIGFDQSRQMGLEQIKSAAKKALRETTPSWRHTDLGRALRFAGDLAVTYEADSDSSTILSDDPANGQSDDPANGQSDDPANGQSDGGVSIPRDPSPSGPAHLVLLTDLQAGSEIESLQAYAWPKELRLDVRKLAPQRRTNAWAQILSVAADPSEDPDRVRVRVSNAADSQSGSFTLAWSALTSTTQTTSDVAASLDTSSSEGRDRQTTSQELPLQVPPGQTRVLRMPIAPVGTNALVLRGDDHDFDNLRYVVSPEPVQLSLAFLGQERSDPRESLLYYLQRVPFSTARRSVTVDAIDPAAIQTATDALNPKQIPLLVLARDLPGETPSTGESSSDGSSSEETSNSGPSKSGPSNDAAIVQLREYVESGGRVLTVLSDRDSSADVIRTVNRIASSGLQVGEADVADYVMLTKIDFSHPVFRSMADPQFNDFSKIRFWSHRKLENLGDSWKVLAQFDDGDPALIEMRIGKGRLLVLATGWQPQGSQLALSTKFIPLVHSLFDLGRRAIDSDQYSIGEGIDDPPSATASITGPSGITFAFRSEADLEGIDQPGVYTYRDGDESRSFAVNLAESESRTESINEDELERFGVLLGKQVSTSQAVETQRQLRDRELEGQQKLWQWLLVTALGILGLETLLGGLWSRRQPGESLAPSSGA